MHSQQGTRAPLLVLGGLDSKRYNRFEQRLGPIRLRMECTAVDWSLRCGCAQQGTDGTYLGLALVPLLLDIARTRHLVRIPLEHTGRSCFCLH